jgi:carbohydrate kinase (thermoresistant glucokinase family)
MGVSGSGKTTIARALAARLGWRFAEGDEFHSATNVAKMRAGIALTDEDRWPWLDAIAAWIGEARAKGERCVVACSALKDAYRQRIAAGRDDVAFVYLEGSYDTIAARMQRRTGHYMPLTLLRSQFDALEAPSRSAAITVGIEQPPEKIVDDVIGALGIPGPGSP